MKRKGLFYVSFAVVLLAIIGVLVGRPQSEEPAREIVLIAKEMSFIVQSGLESEERNPTLRLEPGESIKIVFHNQDPGIYHDLRIESLGIQTGPLAYGESEQFIFQVPKQTGDDQYACSIHGLVMNGRIVIR
ncbi:MAG: hypothetical protein V3U86_07675 [Acidobacteriota bacterium]